MRLYCGIDPGTKVNQGDADPIVVVGVTSHQGERESRSQGEGGQELSLDRKMRGMRNAEN